MVTWADCRATHLPCTCRASPGRAALTLLASFCIHFLQAAPLSLQPHLQLVWSDYFHSSRGHVYSVTWLQCLLVVAAAVLWAFVLKRLELRVCGMLGGVMTSLGYVASSLTPNIGFLHFSHGVLGGLGTALVAVTATVATLQCLPSRVGLAAATATSGLALGHLVWPHMFTALVDTYAWRGAMLLVGGLSLHVLVFIALLQPSPLTDRFIANKKPIHEQEFAYITPNQTSGSVTQSASNYSNRSQLTIKSVRNVIKGLKCFSRGALTIDTAFILFVLLLLSGNVVVECMTPRKAGLLMIDRSNVPRLLSVYWGISVISRPLAGWLADHSGLKRADVVGLAATVSGICLIMSEYMDTLSLQYFFLILIAIINSCYLGVLSAAFVEVFGDERVQLASGCYVATTYFSSFCWQLFSGWVADVTSDAGTPFTLLGTLQIVAAGALLLLSLLHICRDNSGSGHGGKMVNGSVEEDVSRSVC